MTDDKDPALVRLFAAQADPAPPPDFAATVERRIARLRRRQTLILGVGLALSGGAVFLAAALVGPPTPLADAWLLSPGVMAAGAGLALLLAVASRRRLRRG